MHGAQIGMASKRKTTQVLEGVPTPERLRHAGNDMEWGEDERKQKTILTMRDSPIERARSRGIITERQYQAAQKFRHHWYHAGLSDGISSIDLGRIFATDVSGFSGMARSEAQVFHRQQYRLACSGDKEKRIEGLGLVHSALVENVACREMSFEDAGRRMGWGNRPQAVAAATERLRMALDTLCGHWGL